MSKRDNMAVPEGKGNVQVSELPEPITSQPTQAPAFTDPSERGRLAGGNGAAVRQFALEINSQAALDFLEGRQSRNPFQIRVGPERAGFSPGGLPPVIKGSDEPISLRAFVGSTRYYRLREADFRRRNPGKKAPVYYLGYGDKYLHRFSEVTRPKLSPKGQRWLDGTLRTLQDLIEDRRDKDPAAYAELERNDAAATDFYFATHPEAYLGSGLLELGPSDIWLISTTPDRGDLLGYRGIIQVLEVFGIAVTFGGLGPTSGSEFYGRGGTATAGRRAE